MTCKGCKSDKANVIYGRFSQELNDIVYVCNICSEVRSEAVPDVYYGYGGGIQKEENLAYPKGHPQEGQAIPFSSKREKLEAMKIAGVREAGDKVHGYRNEDMTQQKRRKYFI